VAMELSRRFGYYVAAELMN